MSGAHESTASQMQGPAPSFLSADFKMAIDRLAAYEEEVLLKHSKTQPSELKPREEIGSMFWHLELTVSSLYLLLVSAFLQRVIAAQV